MIKVIILFVFATFAILAEAHTDLHQIMSKSKLKSKLEKNLNEISRLEKQQKRFEKKLKKTEDRIFQKLCLKNEKLAETYFARVSNSFSHFPLKSGKELSELDDKMFKEDYRLLQLVKESRGKIANLENHRSAYYGRLKTLKKLEGKYKEIDKSVLKLDKKMFYHFSRQSHRLSAALIKENKMVNYLIKLKGGTTAKFIEDNKEKLGLSQLSIPSNWGDTLNGISSKIDIEKRLYDTFKNDDSLGKERSVKMFSDSCRNRVTEFARSYDFVNFKMNEQPDFMPDYTRTLPFTKRIKFNYGLDYSFEGIMSNFHPGFTSSLSFLISDKNSIGIQVAVVPSYFRKKLGINSCELSGFAKHAFNRKIYAAMKYSIGKTKSDYSVEKSTLKSLPFYNELTFNLGYLVNVSKQSILGIELGCILVSNRLKIASQPPVELKVLLNFK